MFKRFLTSLSTVAIVAMFALAVLFGWSKTGWKALAVPTGSMKPSISQNSLVFVHHTDTNSLKVGDIITYMNPLQHGQTLSHRIIKTEMLPGGVEQFTTKGDANKVADIPVTSGAVIGKVMWHVPKVGAWLIGSKTWVGIAFLVYLPAIVLMGAEIKRMSDYLRLSMPKDYRLFGYRPKATVRSALKSRYAATVFAVAFIGASAVFALPVYALLQSNTVTLGPNTLSVAAQPPPSTCTGGTNNTNVNVNSTSTQTATSGSASNSGNTTGGTATSGNASNNNSTNVNITVNNGC